ncbi:efflux RND transporter periplasmic adaptor subunit [Cytophagaceae bacterium DM2B3-1]|uniref:Efflux RND transporter periplasmic adaptor subunit n=1 Tax=Xanthocytophaga flava TaxID=3048013 RepID=A0ABT7CGY0_9BACT|nr:efflux RND transporter periplasmic adaptor subunit [Xanthocytophaga flavus]MDJ1493003.1 efflux RND transporter periplasmic adaptor subunit [Xanthocytophaga flavus]
MRTDKMLVYVYTLGLVALGACQSKEQEKKTEEKKAIRTFHLTSVEQKGIAQDIHLPGEFKPFQEVSMYAKVSGFVEKVLVDRGSAVRRNQVLLTIEAPETEEQLVAARSKLMQAEAVFVGSKDNYQRMVNSNQLAGSVAALDLKLAYSRMISDSAAVVGERANLRSLEKIKSYLIVRAPFDGVITQRNVHPGTLVGPGEGADGAMLVLQQQTKLRLVVDVPETYSAQIRPGDLMMYYVNALPGRAFKGKVSRTSGSLNQRFRSETVEIDVDNIGQQFKPGMFAEITLTAQGTPGAFMVPSSAIVTSTGGKYIIRVEDQKAHILHIQEGNKAGSQIEIFGNLAPNDRILVNPGEDIKDGDQINI